MTLKDLREDRKPADLWYWSDWYSSFDVRSCSLAARGLWVEMLGIMSRAAIKGTLTVNEHPLNVKELAKLVGASEEETGVLLQELKDHSVFSEIEGNIIINRRMYRQSELSRVRSEAGKKGADQRWLFDGKKDSKSIASLEDEDENAIENKEKKDSKFDEFWKIYPKKVQKEVARCAWKKIIKAGNEDLVIQAAKGYINHLANKSHQQKKEFSEMFEFMLYPATFLNKDRWKDFIDIRYIKPL